MSTEALALARHRALAPELLAMRERLAEIAGEVLPIAGGPRLALAALRTLALVDELRTALADRLNYDYPSAFAAGVYFPHPPREETSV